MERHRVLRLDVVDRHPPVDLARRCGVPRVAMRVPRVGDARGEIAVAGGGPHLRDLEVGFLAITAHRFESLPQVLLGFRMVDELRLELAEDLRALLHGKVVLRLARVERVERGLDQLARERAERDGARARRVDDEVAGIQTLAPDLIREGWIDMDRRHRNPPGRIRRASWPPAPSLPAGNTSAARRADRAVEPDAGEALSRTSPRPSPAGTCYVLKRRAFAQARTR